MVFETPLIHGFLLKRYNRFLADVKLDNGAVVTAHCTNSGSMKSCIEENADVYLTPVDDPKRKTKFTWEMICINGQWVGVNTSVPNVLVYDAVVNNEISILPKYASVMREVKFGDSRFDVYAENDIERCFIEVKNVTMKEGGVALFPDAKTTRGLKHLNTLVQVKQQGMRAVMVYVIQRMDVAVFGLAKAIDSEYAEAVVNAMKNGVEVIAMQAKVEPQGITLVKELPFKID
jgi:sugar fermentation stimulation protein A